MLYFQEYKGYTPLSTIMFVVGVAVVFFGVYLLTKSQASRSHAPPAAAAAGQLEKVNMMSAYDGDAYALDSSSPFQVDADGSANGANGARCGLVAYLALGGLMTNQLGMTYEPARERTRITAPLNACALYTHL